MAIPTTVSTLISSCPAPVSDATGVSSALAWIALTGQFALENIEDSTHDYQPIASRSFVYFDQIPLSSVDYVDINNKLMHLKDLLMAIQTLDGT